MLIYDGHLLELVVFSLEHSSRTKTFGLAAHHLFNGRHQRQSALSYDKVAGRPGCSRNNFSAIHLGSRLFERARTAPHKNDFRSSKWKSQLLQDLRNQREVPPVDHQLQKNQPKTYKQRARSCQYLRGVSQQGSHLGQLSVRVHCRKHPKWRKPRVGKRIPRANSWRQTRHHARTRIAAKWILVAINGRRSHRGRNGTHRHGIRAISRRFLSGTPPYFKNQTQLIN